MAKLSNNITSLSSTRRIKNIMENICIVILYLKKTNLVKVIGNCRHTPYLYGYTLYKLPVRTRYIFNFIVS